MPVYVALLRGIAPMNPNMRNAKLRQVFEDLGFTNVATVISSGNVIFESPSTDVAALEAMIEQEWPKRLGFTSATIIRTKRQLQDMVASDPFDGMKHSPKQYLTVTFAKKPSVLKKLASQPKEKGFEVLGERGGAVFAVIDMTSAKTPQMMAWAEKQFGREITTRTWLTVQRILRAMG